MNRFFLSIICLLLFTTTNHAQYTSIINANRPGDAQTPYAVGRGVLQVENTMLSNNLNIQNTNYDIQTVSNDINIHYGFLSERLEASINHRFSHGTLNNNDITGTENLSIGLKYLVYEHINKESPELKKSWKRRYGFKYNGLIPSIAIAAKYHSPFSHQRFYNGGLNSFSFSVITQNSISKKVRLNNQLTYHNFGGNYAQMVYTISSSYVVAKRWNPYLQAQLFGSNDYQYATVGIGTPFLVSKNLAIAANYKASIGSHISGHEVGIHASFRIDNHKDRWKKIKKHKNNDDDEILNTEDEDLENDLDEEDSEETIKTDSVDDNQSLDEFLKELEAEEEKPKKEKKVKKKKKKKKKKKEEKPEANDFILSY